MLGRPIPSHANPPGPGGFYDGSAHPNPFNSTTPAHKRMQLR